MCKRRRRSEKTQEGLKIQIDKRSEMDSQGVDYGKTSVKALMKVYRGGNNAYRW